MSTCTASWWGISASFPVVIGDTCFKTSYALLLVPWMFFKNASSEVAAKFLHGTEILLPIYSATSGSSCAALPSAFPGLLIQRYPLCPTPEATSFLKLLLHKLLQNEACPLLSGYLHAAVGTQQFGGFGSRSWCA